MINKSDMVKITADWSAFQGRIGRVLGVRRRGELFGGISQLRVQIGNEQYWFSELEVEKLQKGRGESF